MFGGRVEDLGSLVQGPAPWVPDLGLVTVPAFQKKVEVKSKEWVPPIALPEAYFERAIVRGRKEVKWREKEALKRYAQLEKWKHIIELHGQATPIAFYLEGSPEVVGQSIADLLHDRSTATLGKRAGALLLAAHSRPQAMHMNEA